MCLHIERGTTGIIKIIIIFHIYIAHFLYELKCALQHWNNVLLSKCAIS